jgi:malic enzyme
MLDKKIPQFENKIFITVAIALANMVENPSPNKIIPSMFDVGVKETVYNAVASLK